MKIKTTSTFILLLLVCQTFAADKIAKKKKTGNLLYLKTEVLYPIILQVTAPKAYYFDISSSIRINNYLHWTNTYGIQHFYLEETQESPTKANYIRYSLREALATNMITSSLRYFPIQESGSWLDFLFFEAGYHFHNYTGNTYEEITDNGTLESKSQVDLTLIRRGIEMNVGLCQLYKLKKNNSSASTKKQLLSFSPEIYVGFSTLKTQVIKDEFTNILGTVDYPGYSEDLDLAFHIRLKLGFGIF